MNGHDSVEDSVIALELAFRYAVDNYTNELHSSDRLLKLAKVGVFDLNMKESIFARIQKNLLAATRADKKNSTNGTAFAAIVPCQAELQTWEKTAYAYGYVSLLRLCSCL